MAKVFVATMALPLMPEEYLFVKGSKKAAEKGLREIFPHMRSSDHQVRARDGISAYASDSNYTKLLFIHEEEV